MAYFLMHNNMRLNRDFDIKIVRIWLLTFQLCNGLLDSNSAQLYCENTLTVDRKVVSIQAKIGMK